MYSSRRDLLTCLVLWQIIRALPSVNAARCPVQLRCLALTQLWVQSGRVWADPDQSHNLTAGTLVRWRPLHLNYQKIAE